MGFGEEGSMRMPYKRAHRVSDLVQEVICEIIQRDLNDPRLELLTITDVEITDDLRLATVFFSTLGNLNKEEAILDGLQRATGYIKKQLGGKLQLRYIPDLIFKVDHSFEYGSKIDRLLQTIQEEKDRDPKKDR